MRRLSSSARTISRERGGAKRQSDLNETTMNAACARERRGEIAAEVRRRIEVVERLGDAQIRVGVEVARELLALVAQVGLDLEVDVEVEAERIAPQQAAELLHHGVVRKVSDVADHARDAQAAR